MAEFEKTAIDAENIVALKTTRQIPDPVWNYDLFGFGRWLSESFGVPISVERAVDPDDLAFDDRVTEALSDFSIVRDSSLAYVLNEVVQRTNGDYSWANLHNTICILPEKKSPEAVESVLDLVVSLVGEQVSTWEALKIAAREANEAYLAGRGFAPVRLSFVGLDSMSKPPSAFTEDIIGDFQLTNVPLREAICKVFNASGLEMSYHHLNVGPARPQVVTIAIYENGIRLSSSRLPELNMEEHMWWRSEIDEGTKWREAYDHYKLTHNISD